MLSLSPAKALLLLTPLVAAHASHDNHDSTLLRRQVPPGTDTSSVPRPNLGFVPYGADIRSCSVPGKVALTFDDGPGEYTAQLLEILAANNAKATFFVNGNNPGMGLITDPSNGHRAVLQRMYKDGHQIGSHTYTHADLTTTTGKDRAMELIYNEMALVDILGFFPTYIRPPYTSCDGSCLYDMGALGYHVANYDVDTKDYEGDYDYAKSMFAGNLSLGNPGYSSFISLAHDIHPITVQSLAQWLIDEATERGYELVTMGDCLGDAPANWYRDPKTGGAWTGPPPVIEEPEPEPEPEPTTTKTTKTTPTSTPKPTPTTPTTTTADKTSTTPTTTSSTKTTTSTTEIESSTVVKTSSATKSGSPSQVASGGNNVGHVNNTPTPTPTPSPPAPEAAETSPTTPANSAMSSPLWDASRLGFFACSLAALWMF